MRQRTYLKTERGWLSLLSAMLLPRYCPHGLISLSRPLCSALNAFGYQCPSSGSDHHPKPFPPPHPHFSLPVMAAVAVRKKVVSIGHFSPNFLFLVIANLFAC